MSPKKKHRGTIEQRGDSSRVILYSDRKRHTDTLRGGTRKEAEAFARERWEQLERKRKRREQGLPGSMPMSALLDKYEADQVPLLAASTGRSYRGSLAVFRSYFVERLGDPSATAVGRRHVGDFMRWRRLHRRRGDAPLSNRTLQKDRMILLLVFKLAQEMELREDNPVALVKPPKVDARDPVLLDDEQFVALLGECAADPMLHLYVLALGDSGGRCDSEILRLRWEDVDLQGGFLFIRSGREGHRTKSGRGRWIPMTPRLREAMRRHFETYRLVTYGGSRSAFVFHRTRARRHAEPGERIRSLRRAFRGAAKRAELPDDLHQHDLRHRRVTTWLAGGANPVHVKEAMGHADLRTTMGYTHLAREHLRGLVEQPDREELKGLNESQG